MTPCACEDWMRFCPLPDGAEVHSAEHDGFRRASRSCTSDHKMPSNDGCGEEIGDGKKSPSVLLVCRIPPTTIAFFVRDFS